MTAPAGGVAVRMYRQGVGDCFLLAFPAAGGGEFYVLVDCGILQRSPQEAATMRAVAADVADATGGHVHVVIPTHEHYDHLSGFRHAKATFDAMTFGAVWAAWTEDRVNNRLAKKLHARNHARGLALTAAVGRLRAAGSPLAPQIEALLAFSEGVEADMRYVLERAAPRYLKPGPPAVELPEVPGARFYVLGPPEDEDVLHQMDPREGEGYGLAAVAARETALVAALLGGRAGAVDDAGEPVELGDDFPFDRTAKVRPAAARKDPFFRRHYGFPGAAGADAPSWRRIDDDWLAATADLALQFDSYTNNTSLALAIELTATGHVLVFPGDAQAGNIRTWHDHTWEGPDRTQVTAKDLLRRAVFYKVGHHASHNATLRDEELELMASDELIAMIPVNEQVLTDLKLKARGWNMPFPLLYRRLLQQARGRVLRSDKDFPAKPRTASADEWANFKRRVTVDDDGLYFEVAFT